MNNNTGVLSKTLLSRTDENRRIQASYQADLRGQQPCNLVPAINSTFPIAPYWENIPETFLLNAVIGLILFVIFQICTDVAWKRSARSGSNTGDNIYNDPNLVTMLYGYREPEKWYVVPRYEFIRPGKRHHNHDLTHQSIYVPPKLPLADPIELFSMDSNQEDSKSAEDISQLSREKNAKSMESSDHSNLNKSTKKLLIKSPYPLAIDNALQKSLRKSFKTTVLDNSIVNRDPANKSNVVNEILDQSKKSPKPLDSSFFYPTILTEEQLQASGLSRRLNRFFSAFFRITDADMIYAKGIDAYEYLLFQRHLILIMSVTNIFCLFIILPIHWFFGVNHLYSGDQYSTSFQRTTIKNLGDNSIFYWAHIISSICIWTITMIILKSYRDSIGGSGETQLARRTLLIGNIPLEQRNRASLCQVFKEYFSNCKVEAIQYVYNIGKLEFYQQKLDIVMAAKEYCLNYRRRYKQELMVKCRDVNEANYCNGNCRLCSFFYVCLCIWPCQQKQPALTLYSKEEVEFRNKIQQTFEALVGAPSEYAFVTLRSHRQAKRVMHELTKLKSDALNDRLSNFFRIHRSPSVSSKIRSNSQGPKSRSSEHNVLESHSAKSNDPLDPKNNPHVRSIRSPMLKKLEGANQQKANDLEAGFYKSLKSPAGLALDGAVNGQAVTLRPQAAKLGPLSWSVRYAPHPDNVEYDDLLNLATTSKYTIIFWQVVIVIIFIFFTTPTVVMSILEKWLSSISKNRSKFENLLFSYGTTLLQVITTAVLPALITLVSKQIPYEDTSSKNHSIMLKVYMFLVLMVIVMPSIGMNSAQAVISSEINPRCLFPTDNGAYYINYVISSMFLSTIIELIKPVDIVSYCFLMLTSRSKADFEGARQAIEHEFSVSMNHTAVLLVFTVVMTYAISCPLIAPAGLVYLIIKHAVDHYHLFYTYFTKKVDFRMQNTIDIFVKTAILLMLFQTMIAISINTGTSYFSFVAQIIFFSSFAFLVFNCFYDCTSKALMGQKRKRIEREFCACFYLPMTIDKLLRCDAIPEKCISRTKT